MKASLPLLFAAAIAVSACRDNSSATRRTQNYDVVQEGAASGVTSTINGPGETSTAAVNAPMTSTNADTTTAFAVSTDIVPEGAPGSVASTLTAQPVQGAMGSPVVQAPPPGATQPPPGTIRVYVPASPRRAPAPQQQTATVPRPSRTPTDGLPPMHSSTTATEPPATETQPVTDTQASPATDTQTQAAPPENTKKKKKEEPPPPPPDDEPPPPPPSTSTSTVGPG